MLFIRYWIGAIFFASGLTKIADWQSTPFLLEHEYQTLFLPVWFAAGSATLFELAMPVLLIGGLFARLTTLLLIVTTAVIQFTSPGLTCCTAPVESRCTSEPAVR